MALLLVSLPLSIFAQLWILKLAARESRAWALGIFVFPPIAFFLALQDWGRYRVPVLIWVPSTIAFYWASSHLSIDLPMDALLAAGS